MIFRGFLENLYRPFVQIKVVAYLLEENIPTSEREIARILGISHVSVNKAFKNLNDLNLVSPKRIGSSLIWDLNKASYAYSALDIRFYSSCKPIDHLKGRVRDLLGGQVVKAVIFGSIADGKESPSSDIDLAVIVNSQEEKKNINNRVERLASECLTQYGNRLSVHIFTKAELEKQHEIKKSVEKGIVVVS